MNRSLALVLHPARLVISFTGRGKDGGVDQRSGLDRHRLRFELQGHGFKQGPVTLMRNEQLPKSDEGGALGRCVVRRKTAEAAKGSPIVERLGQFYIGQIVPDRQQQGFEHRQRRPGRLAPGRRIKRIETYRDRPPVYERYKRIKR